MAIKTIIIARDGDEAQIISKSPLARQNKILTLSPGAAAIFKDSNFDTIDTTAVYTDDSHAKSITNQKNVQSEFRQLAPKTLSPIQIEAAANTLFYMSGAASFYYQVLKSYDRFYILNDSKLEEINGFEKAFTLIITRIFKKRYAGREHEFSSLHHWLMKKYNAHLDKKLKGKPKLLVIDGSRPSSKNFAKEVVKINSQQVILSGRNPVKSIYVALRHMRLSLKTLKRKDYFSGRIPMYFIYPAKTREYNAEAESIANAAKTEFSRLLFAVVKPYIAEIFQSAAGYEQEAANHINNLQPQIITADGIASGYTMSLCKAARAKNIKTILFNHASHSPQTQITSREIGNLWASFGIIHSPYASHIAARSPAVAALSREIDAGGNIMAVRHDKKIPLKPHDKFKILLAGNYLNVQEHVPWMLETPDEFIKGIAELVEAVAQIPEIELTIRVKPGKKDFNADIMQKFIPAYPNVIISNQGTLKEALAETDLMVASISSTVDEALHSGRPILLHSWPKRYQHLPEGGAVYTSKRGESLVELLKKIMAAKPPGDKELAPYTWPESEPDMAGLAKRILL